MPARSPRSQASHSSRAMVSLLTAASVAACAAMRRALALWLLLFGVYAATLKLDDYSCDEPHYLLAVESLAHDGDVDVSDEYAARAYEKFGVDGVDRHGKLSKGRLD